MKLRQWIREHFFVVLISFVLIGSIIALFGGMIYYQFANAPNYFFKSGFSGFGIARNDTDITPDRMIVGIGIEPPELWFQYFFTCSANGTYNFFFVFPFNITTQRFASETMSYNSTPYGSVVYLQHDVNNVTSGWLSQEIFADFWIENTFKTGTRGAYTFILPFGMGVHSEAYQDVWKELKVGFHSPDANITLQVGLPSHFRLVNAFPPVSRGPNRWTTPYNNTIDSMEWQFVTLQDSVTIQTEDGDEISYYENLPFVSGLLLSIGIPTIVATAYDAIKEWARSPEEPEENGRTNKDTNANKMNPLPSEILQDFQSQKSKLPTPPEPTAGKRKKSTKDFIGQIFVDTLCRRLVHLTAPQYEVVLGPLWIENLEWIKWDAAIMKKDHNPIFDKYYKAHDIIALLEIKANGLYGRKSESSKGKGKTIEQVVDGIRRNFDDAKRTCPNLKKCFYIALKERESVEEGSINYFEETKKIASEQIVACVMFREKQSKLTENHEDWKSLTTALASL